MTDKIKGWNITITEADLIAWQNEFQQLQVQQVEIQQKINNVHQNILFAQRYLNEQRIKNGETLPQQTMQTFVFPFMQQNVQNVAARSATPQATPKLPDVIMSFFSPGGNEKRTKLEIKKALKDKGFSNLGTNDAYFYTTMKRLVEKNQLIREGEFYSRKLL